MFKAWDKIAEGCLQGDKGDVATLGCIPALFSNIISALLMFAGVFSLVIFIIGGYRYINSAGDPKMLEGARRTFIYGVFGLMIVLLSFFIMNIISSVTGVKCIVNFSLLGFGCQP